MHTCRTSRMSWLHAAERGTSWTPWQRGPPFLVARGALRRTSQDSASVAAELLSMRWMERLAGGVTLQNLSESCTLPCAIHKRSLLTSQNQVCNVPRPECIPGVTASSSIVK